MSEHTLRKYLSSIPDGKKRGLIGNQICDAIKAYKTLIRDDKEIDYTEILIERFGDTILIDTNNGVLESIILWADKDLRSILNNEYNKKGLSLDEFLEKFASKAKRLVKSNDEGTAVNFLKSIDIDPKAYYRSTEKIYAVAPQGSTEYPLHPFQKNIKDRSISLLLNPEKSNRHIIHMPTGSGKTKTAMEIISDFIRSKIALGGFESKSNIIWFAHSQELCEQAFESFKATWSLRGDVEVNTIKHYAEYNLTDQWEQNKTHVVFTSFQKMLKSITTDKEQLRIILDEIRNNADLVVIDEAHRTMAKEWNKAIDFFISNPKAQLIGLTATPGASGDSNESRYLSHFFESTKISLVDSLGVTINTPVRYLQKQEFLADVSNIPVYTNYDIEIKDEDYKQFARYGESKFNHILSDLTRHPGRNKILIKQIEDLNSKSQSILIFACSVEHCYIIQSILLSRGIHSYSITGGTPKAFREKYIAQFKNGSIKILINFGVLTTGFDAPITNTVIIARPVFSIVLYSQMIGRALRGPKNGGHKSNTVLTLKDNISHGEVEDLFNSFEEIWR